MTAQTLNEMNAHDMVWQIQRLQKKARLNNVIQSVVNQRSTH